MKKRYSGLILGLAMAAVCAQGEERMKLWYQQSARDWQKEALPIGNGRLGAMIFGEVGKEHIQFNEDTLWVGDEQDTGAYQTFGDLYIDLGAGATAAGVSCPSAQQSPPAEDVTKSIDGQADTKWCLEHGGKPVVWQSSLTEPAALHSYTFISANDLPARDPQHWQLLGSNDGKDWTLLDEQHLEKPFPKRHGAKSFTFKNTTSFKLYRFVFQPTDKTHFQVAEVGLGDAPAAAAGSQGTGYERALDIDRAVHTLRYVQDGTTYTRTYFSSRPAQVMVFHLTADKPGAYTGTVSLVDAHKAVVKASANRLTASGSLAGYTYRSKRAYDVVLNYEAQVLVLNQGGKLEAEGDGIAFRGCDGLTILLAAGTDYLNQRDQKWRGDPPGPRITAALEAAAGHSFDALLAEHTRDYQSLYQRCVLDLGESSAEIRALPTDKRLAAYRDGGTDPELELLLYQYARYLMISSSRPGCMPANLQGLWNHSNRPPWRSDYHTDVNIEMNYWFVDAANLPECFQPLAEWVYSIRGVRRDETQKAFNTRGWMTHAENGIFGGSTWKWSKGDAAWVAQNLWDHYAFTRDKTYLRERAYPIMKELCEFWVDYLKALPDGTLVSPNGFSPEHGPTEDGVSFDQQLVWDLFTNTIEASQALDADPAFRDKLASMKVRLLGPQIGRWGQLQEWMVDRDDPNDHHRHLSHLIAVHPGRQISPLTTPKLAEAAKVSMNARGDGATGWSKAWKINIWARLHDGNRAYKLLSEMLRGNIYSNLFDTHPPFQIDGNFGYASGIGEMLLQSHMGVVHFLPALPDAWPTGSARGLRARGGLGVDLHWQDGRAVSATLHATVDGSFRLRAPDGQQLDGPDSITLRAGESRKIAFK